MVIVPDSCLWGYIQEDVPSIDLTTEVLGIAAMPGAMEYYTREACMVCCTEEMARIMAMLGVVVDAYAPTGTRLQAGETFLRAHGSAQQLHAAWKVCLNLADHYSAVATNADAFVRAVHAINAHCEVLTTRKSLPGTKPLMTKAIMAGGAFPHRMGLSESVLVFENHTTFMGGIDGFIAALPDIRSRCSEKKIFVEAGAEESLQLAEAGVDGLQFDKIEPAALMQLVARIRTIDPHITLVAAGGINKGNAATYATTGVDGLVTTALFTAKPLDMSVRMKPDTQGV